MVSSIDIAVGNGYSDPSSNSLKKLFSFHLFLITLGNIRIQLFPY